ncbi:MAG: excinuclease ABC subunit UvrA [Patescibacteria group bacterium]|nr:excinuclease ABC subunit UvrA [Patescibacteria group bacterium]
MKKHKHITIKGAREHNLKNVNLKIPRDKFIVFTGLSGSGKSTLAFDTIFAEGQRRYLESLSSYARQFLGQLDKPDVDYVEGLSPAISIDQKSASHNPRSTVGTVTEIQDYLRLLYAKIGIPHCSKCGREISKLSTEEIVEKILDVCSSSRELNKKAKKCEVEILAPIVRERKGEYTTLLGDMFKRGFSKAYVDGKLVDLASWKKVRLARYKNHSIDVLVDMIVVSSDNITRIFEAVESSLDLAEGFVKTRKIENKKRKEDELVFNRKLACPIHDISFPGLEPRLFSFNSSFGACASCEGLGAKKEINLDLVMPDQNKTIAEGGLIPWSYKRNNYYGVLLGAVCQQFGISQHTRMKDLSDADLEILLNGPSDDYEKTVTIKYHFKTSFGHYNVLWDGIVKHLLSRYRKTQSDSVHREIEKYMSNKPCSKCNGTRYKNDVLLVTIGGKNIAELSNMSVRDALKFLQDLSLSERENLIAKRIVKEVENRLSFLENVGLEYLTLSRTATTLSGGEAQRIRLASQIGAGLVGVLYILDEPSIGLHARDNSRLLGMLVKLKELGNTVIVIEHDEETILSAEHLVDIGPGAGRHGGRIVHNGTVKQMMKDGKTLTAQYLSGKKKIEVPRTRRKVSKKKMLVVRGASQHNLRNITVEFPTKAFTCVTGVSGSGKSTLVEDILYKWLSNRIHRSLDVPGKVKEIAGYYNVNKVIMIDQSPIGRTPRSNPVTYTGAFTPIRKLFASTVGAKQRGYEMGRFSFNVLGGRCENCKGDGYLKIEMQFMPDVYLPCDVCGGKRYNSETLKVKYKGKSISDVLDMTVNQATDFFENFREVHNKLKTMKDVGLGYIKLGQAATTLSGGEAQRIKLSSELSKRSTGNTLYVLDEPTTGLHFDDIEKLLGVLNRLVDAGNSVVVIEHNMDVIKSADWIVDLGPEGGDEGGRVVVTGTPEEVAKWHKESHTAKYLKQVLGK